MRSDKPREECGVIAIYSPEEPSANLAYFGLYALQHRGQEAAGIAVSDGQEIHSHKELGMVTQVFNPHNLAALPGHLAIGHTRYSTSGAHSLRNAQPFLLETQYGPLAMAHNGNLVNTRLLRQEILAKGVGLPASSDSAVMIMALAGAKGETWEARLKQVMPSWRGAYSLVILTMDQLLAVRDPWGFRPLSVGKLPKNGFAAASETCALQTLGCHDIREVKPGEIITIDKNGLKTEQGMQPHLKQARCTFEQIYFSRPDSNWDGMSIYSVRERLGEALWEEMQSEADLVIPVPDSAVPAAIGFSRASKIPFNQGLIKNRYIGRTFIEPTQTLRQQGVAMKFNALRDVLNGKRIILVDDSIVRGNTLGPLVKLLKEAGAKAVYVGVTCPPITHPCYMGVDMGTREELIAHDKDIETIRKHINADKLCYLSLAGMMRALEKQEGYCNACFTGIYPIEIDPKQTKTGFEQ